jgi:formamidopyrimidine-DNA glycosylase
MPELPEVETTCRGIAPHIEGKTIIATTTRHHQLRWPVPNDLANTLQDKIISRVYRRAKYCLLESNCGSTLILHLGMSGHLRILSPPIPEPEKHDHLDIQFSNQKVLRLTDPRRFGAILWTDEPIEQHTLIQHLGPEPLSDEFDTDLLYQKSRNRRCNIKGFIMDGKIVVGVGNIYANEALFLANIHPEKPAGKITKKQSALLASTIKQVLTQAIKAGGTTLKDFSQSDGKPGYFSQQLTVYGRANEPCVKCMQAIQLIQLGQRATYFCSRCQKK